MAEELDNTSESQDLQSADKVSSKSLLNHLMTSNLLGENYTWN